MDNLPQLRDRMIIEELKKENDDLRLELKLLQSTSVKLKVSPEELICIQQIDVLHNRSCQRELSLDEVKRLDILIKNLRLIRNESTEVINTTSYSSIEEDDLVAIATRSNEITK